MAYEKVTGPLGPERFDQLNAVLAMVTASPWTEKGKKVKVGDFMPEWDHKPETPEERKQRLKAWAHAMGGTTGG